MKIAGSDINIDHADIKGKNIQELKKLDIFSHLPNDEQEKAYEELEKLASNNYGPVIKTSLSELQKSSENTIELEFDADALTKSQEEVLKGLKDTYEASKKYNGDKDK